MRVLVVDKDQETSDLFSSLLEPWGHELRVVSEPALDHPLPANGAKPAMRFRLQAGDSWCSEDSSLEKEAARTGRSARAADGQEMGILPCRNPSPSCGAR